MDMTTRQWTKGGGAAVGKLKEVFVYGDGSVRPLTSVESAVYEIRRSHPGGCDHILIGHSRVQGMKITQDSGGIIAVLIGLLLPAIETLTDGTSNTVAFLETALRPGGTVGFVMADGTVRNVHGQVGHREILNNVNDAIKRR